MDRYFIESTDERYFEVRDSKRSERLVALCITKEDAELVKSALEAHQA